MAVMAICKDSNILDMGIYSKNMDITSITNEDMKKVKPLKKILPFLKIQRMESMKLDSILKEPSMFLLDKYTYLSLPHMRYKTS